MMMNRSATASPLFQIGHGVLSSIALSGSFLLATVAMAAAPSQTPLTSRSGDIPPPNVMITIDDSSSMLSDGMPEGDFTLNGKTVSVIKSYVAGFPDDDRKPGSSYACAAPANSASPYLFQMQFRSPDVNTIWYNPETRYQPWFKPQAAADGSGVRMADSNPAAARWDPVVSNRTFALNQNKSYETTWCTSSSDRNSFFDTMAFNPGLYYRLAQGADPTKSASYTKFDVNDANIYGPTLKSVNRTDCAAARCTQREELQNFANWFTYYRMRESMAKAAVTEAFFNFKDKLRAGYGRINKSNESKVDGGTLKFKGVEKGIAQLDSTQLALILNGVQGIESTASTPLRKAIDYVGTYFYNRTDSYSPWVTTPGATSSPGNQKLACRRAINVLTTDGYYNDGYDAAGDLDTTANTYNYSSASDNPNGYSPTKYTPKRPFMDAGGSPVLNTLADAAMRWYIRDLDSTVPNKIAPVDGDIAYWQHLTQFTVGIGVKGSLDSSSQTAKAATLAALTNGTANWPSPSTNPGKIDDLWHAAVNTGGDFYSVKNVTELTNALSNAFGRAVGNDAREAGVATVASTLVTNNLKFVPQYKSGAWYGDVLAYRLDDNGDVQNANPVWKASSALPAFSARNLVTWNGTAPAIFSTGDVNAVGKGLIATTTAEADKLIGYIRGDTTNEGAAASYRSRGAQLLGDFVNSPPVFVKNLLNLNYQKLSTAAQSSTYAAYQTAKNARTAGVVGVGGNAGIFHLFREDTGAESFGFVPREGYAGFATIANKTYGGKDNYHRFFVDGPTVEVDAFITPRGESSSRWTNLLMGSMGAGGKSVFAMHLPTANPTAGMNANSVQWELNGRADLGYVMGDMRTGPIQGGTSWYAFIGNGPYSANGTAALLVVNLQTGSVVKSITLPGANNGLGGVYLLRNAYQEVYAAYAGDLLGNLWRFDFENAADTNTWRVGFGGSALFKALDASGNPQPITAAPVVVTHPSRGYVVQVGTGRLIDAADASSTLRQTFYGVWDPTAANASSYSTTGPFAAVNNSLVSPYRALMVQQNINGTPVHGTKVVNGVSVDSGELFYQLSSNTVNWETQKGWYLDLTIADGQRVVYTPQTILNYVYFSTMVPAAPAAECEYNVGSGYNFVVNAVSGAALTSPVFDVNNDGVVNANDGVVGGMKSQADGIDKLLTAQDNVVGDNTTVQQCLPDVHHKCAKANSCLVVVVNTGNEAEEICVDGPNNCDTNPNMPGCTKVVKDRVWRQLLTPPEPTP